MTIDPTAWAMSKGSGFASLMRLQPDIESKGLNFRAVLAIAQEQHQGLHDSSANSGIMHTRGASHDGDAPLVRNDRPAEISGGITA